MTKKTKWIIGISAAVLLLFLTRKKWMPSSSKSSSISNKNNLGYNDLKSVFTRDNSNNPEALWNGMAGENANNNPTVKAEFIKQFNGLTTSQKQLFNKMKNSADAMLLKPTITLSPDQSKEFNSLMNGLLNDINKASDSDIQAIENINKLFKS